MTSRERQILVLLNCAIAVFFLLLGLGALHWKFAFAALVAGLASARFIWIAIGEMKA